MKIAEAIRNMDKIIAESVSEFGIVMLEAAVTANTLIHQRVVEKGIDADGTPFAPYSTKPMLANCSTKYMSAAICNNLAGSKEKRAELKWVTLKNGAKVFELDGGYKQFRDLHGRQTGHVDFTWSGEMMANIQVVSGDAEHKSGRAIIGTLSEEQNTKLAGNTDRRGEILMLSDSEINDVSEIIENWLADKWNE